MNWLTSGSETLSLATGKLLYTSSVFIILIIMIVVVIVILIVIMMDVIVVIVTVIVIPIIIITTTPSFHHLRCLQATHCRWEQTWLNEGFATYVSYIGSQYIEPEWNSWARWADR